MIGIPVVENRIFFAKLHYFRELWKADVLKGVKRFAFCKEMNSNTILSDPLSGGLLLSNWIIIWSFHKKNVSLPQKFEHE